MGADKSCKMLNIAAVERDTYAHRDTRERQEEIHMRTNTFPFYILNASHDLCIQNMCAGAYAFPIHRIHHTLHRRSYQTFVA